MKVETGGVKLMHLVINKINIEGHLLRTLSLHQDFTQKEQPKDHWLKLSALSVMKEGTIETNALDFATEHLCSI